MLSTRVLKHYDNVLSHLYINPLEKCNLKCKICYTKKTAPILSNADILDFVERYQIVHDVKTITFCGGEVFALVTFPDLINSLTERGIFVQVITNGTIDRLAMIHEPNAVNLIVSLDGLEVYHDANRGEGNFKKSTDFLRKARALGFHTEVFSIITRQNIQFIDLFESTLAKITGYTLPITYHPRKPPAYLMHHPVSNIVGETNGFDFLEPTEMVEIMQTRNVFPPKNLGCYQVALMSDGKVYGCCEGVLPIGSISDQPQKLIDMMAIRLERWSKDNTFEKCLGCTQSEFMCGIKEYLQKIHTLEQIIDTEGTPNNTSVISTVVERSLDLSSKNVRIIDKF